MLSSFFSLFYCSVIEIFNKKTTTTESLVNGIFKFLCISIFVYFKFLPYILMTKQDSYIILHSTLSYFLSTFVYIYS